MPNCREQLGLSKVRANEVERTLTTNDSFLFRSPATWRRNARHGTKILEQ